MATKGLWESMIEDMTTDITLGDAGDFLGGIGGLGTGLYSMFQGNQMMDLYEENMKNNMAKQKADYTANARKYNNELYRSDRVASQLNGGHSSGVGKRKYINESYGNNSSAPKYG